MRLWRLIPVKLEILAKDDHVISPDCFDSRIMRRRAAGYTFLIVDSRLFILAKAAGPLIRLTDTET